MGQVLQSSIRERMRKSGCQLNPNRWAILKALTGAGPLGVRELARRVGRD